MKKKTEVSQACGTAFLGCVALFECRRRRRQHRLDSLCYKAAFIAGIVAASLAGTAAAQTFVIGAGDPDIDIAAVQAAVDLGGSVVLRGRFSFDNPPTRHGTDSTISIANPRWMVSVIVTANLFWRSVFFWFFVRGILVSAPCVTIHHSVQAI